jgi:predicted aldo/keto reductase-like oxidoreductase
MTPEALTISNFGEKRSDFMHGTQISRRDFLKKCSSGTAAIGLLSAQKLFPRPKEFPYDAKGLPTIIYGKTGARVPRMAIGCGSRFCAIQNPEKSQELLSCALNNGFYYWDTAHDYVYNDVVSEERLGLVLKHRRKEVFLATKVGERSYDGAMRHIEESLKRLQTDHLEILQIHSVLSSDDVHKIGAKNGVFRALQKMKDEKVTKFIGFSGHSNAAAMASLAERFDFDTMLIALNHYADKKGDMENFAIPKAAEKNMGIIVMKVIRPRENVEGLKPKDLIRYALSLKQPHVAVIGTDSLEVVKKNRELLKNFDPMSPEEMDRIKGELEPFFSSRDVPWMQPDYSDGCGF